MLSFFFIPSSEKQNGLHNVFIFLKKEQFYIYVERLSNYTTRISLDVDFHFNLPRLVVCIVLNAVNVGVHGI